MTGLAHDGLQAGRGHLAENVMHFARVLRTAGLPLGSDRVLLALEALQVAGLERRGDFHAVLRACLLDRIEHAELFDQAFALFWKDPDLLGRMRALLLPKVQLQPGALPAPKQNRRLGEALFPHAPGAAPPQPEPPPQEQIEIDARLTWSQRELLRQADFDTMTADEWRAARRAIGRLKPVFEQLPTRRMRRASHPGQPDWRATLRRAARQGGELGQPKWQQRRSQSAPLLLLADISGSMSRYSRMLLHLAHTLAQAQGLQRTRVESFVFGTRLTRTTRLLARRDPDVAVAEVVRAVQDWSGGTRITQSLASFNRRWARRTLPGRATVLLISDGLEAGSDALPALDHEMARLARSCRRLLWLNPLLRWPGFEPSAAGPRTLLPHVDRMLPAHNLDSLEQLLALLAQAGPTRPVQPASRTKR
ncbi:MAG: VWA domain-containing protein [Burkholderiaceae bacterium]|nr:VWA domain-containing protein [Burkholderiaceae bacterium]